MGLAFELVLNVYLYLQLNWEQKIQCVALDTVGLAEIMIIAHDHCRGTVPLAQGVELLLF